MKKIFLLSFLSIISLSAWCQTWSYGVKAGYVTYRFYTDSYIEGTHVYGAQGSNGSSDGWRLAALTRAEHKRWFAQAESAYTGGVHNPIIINNWDNPSNTLKSDEWSYSKRIPLNQTELSLSGGYKLKRWLGLSTGLGIWHIWPRDVQELVIHDETYAQDGTTNYESIRQNKRERILYGIQNSYLPFVLTHKVSIAFEIRKNFSLDITYNRSLTSVSKELNYKGQNYTFRQSTDRFVVSVGYRFYKLKNNSKLFKERN